MMKSVTSTGKDPASGVPTPNLVLSEGRYMATSLDLASHFEKPHKEVLQAIIKAECSEDFHRRNFEPVKKSMVYADSDGYEINRTAMNVEYYRVTYDGFAFLGEIATEPKVSVWIEAYIVALGAMEQKVREQSRAELDRTTRIVEDAIRAFYFRGEFESLMILTRMRQVDALVLRYLLRHCATVLRVQVDWVEVKASSIAFEMDWNSTSQVTSALGRLLSLGLIHEERRSARRRAYFAHSQQVIERLAAILSESSVSRPSVLRVVK